MVKLHHALALLAPFALIAMFHHIRFATTSMSGPSLGFSRNAKRAGSKHGKRFETRELAVGEMSLPALDLGGMQGGVQRSLGAAALMNAAGSDSEISDSIEPEEADAGKAKAESAVAAEPEAAAEEPVGAAAAVPQEVAAEVKPRPAAEAVPAVAAAAGDPSVAYPAPTLSEKRLLDGSENWLPVPDAEGDAPSDLAWRRAIPPECKPKMGRPSSMPPGASEGAGTKLALTRHPLFARLYNSALEEHVPKSYVAGTLPAGCVCPPGRRPYHTILTAQASAHVQPEPLTLAPTPDPNP